MCLRGFFVVVHFFHGRPRRRLREWGVCVSLQLRLGSPKYRGIRRGSTCKEQDNEPHPRRGP